MSAQKNIEKAYRDSAKIEAKIYRKELKKSVDSANRVRKRIKDSIRTAQDPDTVPYKKSIRIGIDLSKPVTSFLRPDRQELEFSIDYHYRTRFYLAGEAGSQILNFNQQGAYTYKQSGYYAKAGFDYNIFRLEKRNDNNIVFLGVRLAGSTATFKSTNINVVDPVFGTVNVGNLPTKSGKEFWLEVLFGMKVEVIKHVFAGWNLRLTSRLTDPTKKTPYPLLTPGFGMASDSQNIQYNYSVFYSF